MIQHQQLQQLADQHGLHPVAVLALPLTQYQAEFEQRQQQLLRDGVGDMRWLITNSALRADPAQLLPGAASVVVTLFPYHSAADDDNETTKVRRARYAAGKDYHSLLRKRMMRFGKDLVDSLADTMPDTLDQPKAGLRATVDSAPVDERSLAVLSGLGWLGRNGLVLHPKCGSYHFIAALWTTLPLSPLPAGQDADRCGTCHACQVACPTQALQGRRVISTRCISYWTIEHQGVIPRLLAHKVSGWWFGCDICQQVCPWNRFARPAGDHRLWGRDDQPEILLQLNATTFDQHFAGSAVRRIGYQRFRRNLMVAAFSLNQPPPPTHDDDGELVAAQRQELGW